MEKETENGGRARTSVSRLLLYQLCEKEDGGGGRLGKGSGKNCVTKIK